MIADAQRAHAGLWRFSLVCGLCAVAAAGAGLFDTRLVTGAPVWNKPLKFFLSSAIYTATFAWYLGQVSEPSRASRGRGWWLGTGVWVLLTGELLLITVQAARGTSSHFNAGSAFDASVFAIMGAMIAGLAVLHAVLWVWLLRAPAIDRVRRSACRWGAGLTLGGLLTGALMLGPTSDQLARRRAGGTAPSGAHAVGVPDGGPGLPLVGWSVDGGDRRVAHFVGLHAMQVLPLALLLLPATMGDAARLATIRATGAAYGLLTSLLVVQASQARPVLAPGLLLGTAMLAVLMAWAVVLILLRARPAPRAAA